MSTAAGAQAAAPIECEPVTSGGSTETTPSSAAEAGPQAPQRAGLRLNALAWTVGNLTFFGVVFLITPLAIEHLGSEGWGIWQLVGATSIYAQLLQLGLGTALHYQVAYRTASRDWERLASVFTSVRLFLLLAGLALLALLAVGGRPFVRSLVDAPHQELAWGALVISIIITSLEFQLRPFGSALGGLQRQDLVGVFQMVGAFALLGAVVLGFRVGMDLRGFAALMTLGPGVAAALSVIAVRRLVPPEGLRLRRPDLALFRQTVAYSMSTVLYTVGAVVLYQTMKFMASWRCGGPDAAGHIGLAISMAQTLSVVFAPAMGVLQSRVGQLHGENRLALVSQLLEQALVVLGLLLVPATVFLVQDAPAIFMAWVGGTEAVAVVDELATTTRLLLLGHFFYIAALPFYYVLLGVGQHRVFGFAMVAVAVLNTALGWIATSVQPRIETLGLVYGILMLVLVVGVTAPAGMRRFPVPIGRLLVRGIGVPLLASIPGALAMAWRPPLGQPLLDLALDGAVFILLTVPGLELARRRFGVPLRLRLRA